MLTDLIDAATNLGYYETLCGGPQETVDYWRNEMQQHLAAQTGEHHDSSGTVRVRRRATSANDV